MTPIGVAIAVIALLGALAYFAARAFGSWVGALFVGAVAALNVPSLLGYLFTWLNAASVPEGAAAYVPPGGEGLTGTGYMALGAGFFAFASVSSALLGNALGRRRRETILP